jgi:hypothetical protein
MPTVRVGGWRLPTALNQDGTGPIGVYNVTGNEMGHLFYTELGNKGYLAPDGTAPQPGWGLVNKGPFRCLESTEYWSSSDYVLDGGYSAWFFSFRNGHQSVNGKDNTSFYALAVHDGNVGAPVPIPDALWLFGPGLVGLIGLKRKYLG